MPLPQRREKKRKLLYAVGFGNVGPKIECVTGHSAHVPSCFTRSLAACAPEEPLSDLPHTTEFPAHQRTPGVILTRIIALLLSQTGVPAPRTLNNSCCFRLIYKQPLSARCS